MDAETRVAIADLAGAMERFSADLVGAMDLVRREQKRQGEMLAAIIALLTPEPPGAEGGPPLKELVARLVAGIQGQGASQGEYLKRILEEVLAVRRDLPLEIVRAIDDNLGSLAKPTA